MSLSLLTSLSFYLGLVWNPDQTFISAAGPKQSPIPKPQAVVSYLSPSPCDLLCLRRLRPPPELTAAKQWKEWNSLSSPTSARTRTSSTEKRKKNTSKGS